MRLEYTRNLDLYTPHIQYFGTSGAQPAVPPGQCGNFAAAPAFRPP